ncbi:MAG TPA: TIGR00366 family protein, partial [Phycisphaerales bacterium]|nr:TIGR00366 family protein [Phycisphaerales bacterium]
ATAAGLVAVVATLTGIVNWGLALIVGAIMAREVGRSLARRGIPAHYPLIVASGYTGLMVWHGGLSGSAPLSMTTAVGAARVLPAQVVAGMDGSGVPLTQTILSPLNLVVTGGLLVIIPAVMALSAPRKAEDIRPIQPPRAGVAGEADATPLLDDPIDPGLAATPAERLERSPLVAWLVAALIFAALWRFAGTGSVFSAGLDEINAAMFAVGLAVHRSVRSYLSAAEAGIRGCTGIVLQFPLYAGIMAMAVSSGLVSMLARAMADAMGGRSIPVMTYWSAGLVNLFIPSGGGQWGVQGPIALETAARADIPVGVMVMAVAYGDQTTNMLQPFWALPLLAITGARARDIVAYTCLPMVFGIAWISLVLGVMT